MSETHKPNTMYATTIVTVRKNGEVHDIWTFAKDVRSNDPNWKLVATESDS